MLFIIILNLFILTALGVYVLDKYKDKKLISFQQSLDLTNLPVITAYTENLGKINLLIDTGASVCCINSKYHDSLSLINFNADVSTAGNNVYVNNCTVLSLDIQGKKVVDTFILMDMEYQFNEIKNETGVTIHGIIGTSLMTKYKYIIDFNKSCFYAK